MVKAWFKRDVEIEEEGFEGEELKEEGRLIHHRTHRKGEQHVQELHKNTWDICYHKKRFLILELNTTFDIKCVILMSPLTMATMTPMANLDTKSWLSSMVVTIFVKHPSNAYLNKQAVASRYSAFCFNLTYGLIRSPVESELFDTPVSSIFFQNLLSRSFQWKPACWPRRFPPKNHSPTSTRSTPPEPGY